MPTSNLSVVIITFNEAKNIARCLDSVAGIADEIVVVDSFSTDDTRAICITRGAKFFEHKFDGHVQQKNYAMEMTSFPFVLSLDADEALSEELKQSIAQIKNSGFAHSGYTVNRLTNYCGTWIHHCGWYPDKRIRLWDKQQGKWGGDNPHDVVKLTTTDVGHLNGDLLHYSYGSISEHIAQVNKFTDISSKAAFAKRKKVIPVIHIILYPFFTFLRMYFIKLGLLDGLAGFLVSITGAYYKFCKYSKLRECYKREELILEKMP